MNASKHVSPTAISLKPSTPGFAYHYESIGQSVDANSVFAAFGWCVFRMAPRLQQGRKALIFPSSHLQSKQLFDTPCWILARLYTPIMQPTRLGSIPMIDCRSTGSASLRDNDSTHIQLQLTNLGNRIFAKNYSIFSLAIFELTAVQNFKTFRNQQQPSPKHWWSCLSKTNKTLVALWKRAILQVHPSPP